MDRVYSLGEARDWFIAHSDGSVDCIDLCSPPGLKQKFLEEYFSDGVRERVVATYEEARKFYGKN
jgi:hypothetical protein